MSGMLRLSAVLDRDGWAVEMVELLLGRPDALTEHGSALYALDRVLAAEKSPDFDMLSVIAKVRAAKVRAEHRA